MIEIKKYLNGITVSGHAGYGIKGSDIVCAAISTLTETLVESLYQLSLTDIKYDPPNLEGRSTNSLISAIDKLPNSNTTLNRSLCFSDAKSAEVWYNNIINGEKFETDSFWATTKNYIHNPMGQVQIYIQRAKSGGDLGRYGLIGESEVLFKPGTRFYVDRKEIFNATGIKGQEKFYIFLTEV